MATYILLMTLTPEGRARALEDPEYLITVGDELETPNITTMGCYAVLGAYDFVMLVQAADNEQVARFSLEYGVRGGVHIVTLPAVPVGRLDDDDEPEPRVATDVRLTPPVSERL
jgi:uncharacterized protein with GYD domain